MKRLLLLSMALSGCIATSTVYAFWGPRITGLGEIGEYGSLWADGLFPIQDVSDQVVFFDFQVEANRFYSDNSFSGIESPGLGIRHAFSNENVLGLYVFSDFMMTNAHQNYWFVSPGVDFYHGQGFVALNGYIPVDNVSRKTGSDIAASTMGITQYQTFTGNSQYDHLIQTFYIMRWGMDLTGGMLLGDKNEWQGKLGAYLYGAQNVNTIQGLRGEIDYYFNNHVALTIEDRYDNVFHNQTVVGIKINFLGTDNRGTVESQLKAPMYRNLNINTTNAGTPIGEYYQTTSQSHLIQDNITFVSNKSKPNNAQLLQSATITGDGTYENPYTGLNQDIINKTTKNINIWVEGTGANHPYADATTLTLQTGQSIYGRTDGFKLAASTLSAQPTFNFAPNANTAALYIDNSNTLQNFIMLGNGSTESIGIQSRNTSSNQTALINGLTIGSTTENTGYTRAVYNQGGNISINNSTLYAVKDLVSLSGTTSPQIKGVFGIYNDGGTITVSRSSISTHTNQVSYDSTGLGGDFVGAFGVYNSEGTMSLSDSTVQATSDHVIDNRAPSASTISSLIGSFGLYNTKGTMTVTGSASSINATASGVDNEGNDGNGQGLLDFVGAFGAYNNGGESGNTSTLDIKQANVTASASTVSISIFTLNNPAISTVGVWNNGNQGTATTTVEQSATIDVHTTWQITNATSPGSAVNAFGIYNESRGTSGLGNLIANEAIVTATETGGDGSGSGAVSGIMNGALLSTIGGTAISMITGTTQITARGTGEPIPIYGFYNNGSNNITNGTTITGGSIIDSEGGSSGSSSAVFNSLGTMTIQGTVNQNVMLTANGNNTNNGVWSVNGATTTINYATINVGSANNGYSLGVNNTDNSNTNIQNSNVTVTSSIMSAYGVYNDTSSMATIGSSTFNITTETGYAYGLWDTGGGMTFISPTTLYLNYDATVGGTAAAFSSSGNYVDATNVTCYSNGTQSVCTTS